MSRAAIPSDLLLLRRADRADPRRSRYSCYYGFFFFILANAALFIRPSDFLPALQNVPIYGVFLGLSVCLSLPALYEQFRRPILEASPITACVFGLLGAVILSHLLNLRQWEARNAAELFARNLLYYALLIGLVNSADRLEKVLTWNAVFTIAAAILAVLTYHQVILLPALQPLLQDSADGSDDPVLRLRSAGIFNDPNDFCLALVAAILVCLWRIKYTRGHLPKLAWTAAACMLLYAVSQTRSRGGLIALGAGLLTLFINSKNRRRAALLVVCSVVLAIFLLPARQTEIDIAGDTSLSRLKLWSDGLELFRQSPVFGIGFGQYSEEVGMVAHNSFLHCFVELGLVGGMMFMGAFVQSVWGLNRLHKSSASDSRWSRLCLLLLAMTVSAIAGMLSLSRAYIVPTYTLLGTVAAFQLMAPSPSAISLRLNFGFMHRTVLASLAFLIATYLLVRLTVNWQ